MPNILSSAGVTSAVPFLNETIPVAKLSGQSSGLLVWNKIHPLPSREETDLKECNNLDQEQLRGPGRFCSQRRQLQTRTLTLLV